ncbi:TIGR03086 family protein [Gordonia sp. HNM0687]|uniref:TIGR03086 family protein n=1 Tax=Gordonia mangrovi TaxID=2665643 RepID=A0A6L7GJ55_9ACTN|nr:TIGR03086 family metal-binding protein [Gordonia mangrovi]MXP20000.1 TIGR03086 family protein [Gordonia mangrovi]UVF79384.1 TIGR03086 family metal-binding protein [Gordonia mangrovi]
MSNSVDTGPDRDQKVATPQSLRSLLIGGMALFDERVAEVNADQFGRDTTCDGWTIEDLVQHTADTADRAVAFLRGATWVAPESTGPALDRWRETSAALRAQLKVSDLDGRWPLADDSPHAKLRFHGCDFAIHRWDLAQSLGIDEELPAGWLEYMNGFFRSLPDEAIRRPRAFAPELAPAPSDGPTARLMAFLGRRPLTS